jgi:phosphatidylglycerophosphatase A
MVGILVERRMVMYKKFDNIVLFIAQGAFSGRFPKAPGTAGTVAGVLLYMLLKDLGTLWYCIAYTAIAALGSLAAGRADEVLGTQDSPTIVIDEIAGFLVAMFLIPFSWGYVVAGFTLFRFFDILKPWPLKRLQEVPGGPGVMLDDLGAAVYTNVILQIIIVMMDR